MDNNLITAVGRALYGDRWQTDMARDLDVSDRTVRRWATDAERPRPGVYVDLLRLCIERAQTIDELIERLRENGV